MMLIPLFPSGHEEVAKILIHYGANIEAKNQNDETPSDVADKNSKL